MEDFDKNMEKLREQLNEQSWPDVYFFKFIVPSNNEQIGRVCALFDDTATIKTKESSNGKFTSVSIKVVAVDVAFILDIYRKAKDIEGIISL